MRLFVGFLAPEKLKKHLVAELDRAPNVPRGLRELARETWHVTLTFLGEVDETHLPEILQRLNLWTHKTTKTSFVLTRLETFPIKKPRILAAHFETKEAERFAASVNRLRDMLSIYAPELDRKPWHPHLSIARAKRVVRLPVWQHDIEPIDWFPDALALVKSVPGPHGSKYTGIELLEWNKTQ